MCMGISTSTGSPGGTRHVNVSVEQVGYQPQSLTAIRRLGGRLGSGEVVREGRRPSSSSNCCREALEGWARGPGQRPGIEREQGFAASGRAGYLDDDSELVASARISSRRSG